jgi:predicted metal-dependent HD superfamily phosphohydrolase
VKFEEYYDSLSSDAKKFIDYTKVNHYIMCTKYHFSDKSYNDLDLNYMLDFDLYTFGLESLEDYLRINEGIMYEFTHHYELADFLKGRTSFLNMVLAKDRIYRTEDYYSKYEERARENIKQEIEKLKNLN